MAMRFVIIHDVDSEHKIVIEHNQDQILEALQATVRDKLVLSKSTFKRSWNEAEIAKVLADAFSSVVNRFKALTVKV